MRLRLLLISISFAFGVVSSRPQEIRIVLQDAHRGKPVPNECLNVAFGAWRGADILAATDKDGVATIIFNGNQVSAKPVVGRTCQGIASTKLILDNQSLMRIAVVPDWYVSCQYSKKMAKDPAWLNESPAQRIPAFDVQQILNQGIVATNNCSSLKPTPTPGELVLVVRKRTFWEGMRS